MLESSKKTRTKQRTVRISFLALLVLLVVAVGVGFWVSRAMLPGEWKVPPTVVQASNVELVPVLDRQYFNVTLAVIESASQQLDLAVFQFKFYENEQSSTRRLLDAIVSARSRGVNVRVLLDKSNWNPEIGEKNSETIRYLQAGGVTAKLDDPKRTLHAKLVIADDKVIVGSTNLGFHALEQNNEANVLIHSREVANYYRNYFEMLWV